MFSSRIKQQLAETQDALQQVEARFKAIDRAMAVIEFTPDGRIVTANENFLRTTGYALKEIQGEHHRMFCDSSYASSAEYRDFWQQLNRGEFASGRYPRVDKQGRKIWLEASYNPVFGVDGKLERVIKFASEVTDQVETSQSQQSLIDAIDRSMAVIEFNLQGEVQVANDNFLSATGYTLNELRGKHHRLFCTSEEANSTAYSQFWQRLNRGEYVAGQFKRVNKYGDIIWLEATYNPVFDATGKLEKVVKFASDITAKVNRQEAESEAARMAYDISVTTDETTQQGEMAIQSAMELMRQLADTTRGASNHIEALNEQSDQIGSIVSTINGIAEQTNLLALNAAIEAARAGEAGRGFAVVADEVRQLAARTSASTTEITDVVKKNHDLAQQAVSTMTSSLELAENGLERVNDAGEVMLDIRGKAQSVVSAIEEFAHALDESKA